MKKIFLFLFSLFITTMVFAYDAEIDGIYYNFDDENKTAIVIGGSNEYSGNIIIPEKVSYNGVEYNVTKIGYSAFYGCTGLISVIIGNGVTSIGASAFAECTKLVSVTIPSSITYIGDYAFLSCGNQDYDCWGIKDLYVTANSIEDYFNSRVYTTMIYEHLGLHCKRHLVIDGLEVTDIVIPETIKVINNYTFHFFSSITKITIPNSVTEIGDGAFSGCSGLVSIEIPNSVTSIEDYAFYGCTGLTSIEIPNSVTKIGYSAFYGCTGLVSVSISNIVAWCNIDFKGDNSNPLSHAGNLYLNGEKVTDLVIPEGINILKDRVFSGYTGLTSIEIPNSVTSIGRSAFSGCTGLTTIEIPNSVTEIGSEVFRGCTGLRSVVIPNSITSIESYAFYGCTGLDTIICLATTPPSAWFSFDSYDCLLLIPKGTLDLYKNHVDWNVFKNIKEIKEIYTITTSVNDEIMGSVSDGGVYEEDSEITLTATANEGYCFMKWSDGNTENPRVIKVTKDFTYIANFSKKFTVLTSVNDESMGTVSGAGEYCKGSIIELTAIANDGYRFVKWSDGYIQNPRIIIAKEDIDLMAIFESDGTPVDNIKEPSVQVYVREEVLYVEGTETDYHVFDAAGRLVYSGRESALSLPRGVYVVNVGGEVQKVVI